MPWVGRHGRRRADIATLAKLFGNKPKEVNFKPAPLPPLTLQANMADPLTAPGGPRRGLPITIDITAITTPTR